MDCGLNRKAADRGPGRAEFKLGQMPASKPAAPLFGPHRAMNPLAGDPRIKAAVLPAVEAARLKAADKAQVTDGFNR
jgi:hypothetical protein